MMDIRWLKSLNVVFPSEKEMRKIASTIIDDTMVAERGAFSFSSEDGGEEFREVPFVYFPNLVGKVADLINQHERYAHNVLQLHDFHIHI